MNHEPGIKPFLKLDQFDPAWRGSCSCGWEGNGPLTAARATRSAKDHARDKSRADVVHAEITTDKTPAEVIEAVRVLNAEHYGLLTTAWERATTAISVFGGEGGYAAVRYTLNADLTEVLSVERVSYGKRR